jgi:hypothetical protein
MRGRARPDDEPVQPVKLDGWSMAYQLTSLGAEVDTLHSDAAAMTASGRWRPGPPKSWRSATSVSRQMRIWWHWTTCWQ